MNKVFLSGNLTRDPEVRYTQTGKAFSRMGIAINRRYKEKESVDFFNLIAWNKTAEFCGRYLRKGSRVLVEGNLRTDSYENKDGVKVNSVEIWVDNIEFAGARRDDFGGGDNSNYPEPSNRSYSNRQPEPPAKNDYGKKDYGNNDYSNNDYDDFSGEPIDPDDTPF